MTTVDPLDEEKAIRLRQRLWGAAVFIALLVIFLPLLLDGAGSESQYRRVERLRAEPPRVIDEQGELEPAAPIDERSAAGISLGRQPAEDSPNVATVQPEQSFVEQTPASPLRPSPTDAQVQVETLQAWVIQAGSFQDEQNAIAVRDKLRREGFPSFVTPSNEQIPLYRVQVGPMISLQRAELNREKVMKLLSREAIVLSYP